MWHIKCHNITKRYPNQLLFKDLSYEFHEGEAYAITGSNGSGKSTLLKILSGLIPPSKGKVEYFNGDKLIDGSEWYKSIAICAPYVDLIEEFTLKEHIDFHKKFKKPSYQNIESIIKSAGLIKSIDKPVGSFSSGMKQRLKLILCLCFESNVLLMDEPTSHLDREGKNWYKSLMKDTLNKKITMIFSNEEEEYLLFTNNFLNIENQN